MPSKKDEASYVQEACLGRVQMRRTRKMCYLVKWLGWDALGDITSEPPENVLVAKVEHPLLDQTAKTFQEDLKALLDDYLAQHPGSSSPATAEDSESSDQEEKEVAPPVKAPPRKSQVPEPPVAKRRKTTESKATSSLFVSKASSASGHTTTQPAHTAVPAHPSAQEDVSIRGATYSVMRRQFLVVEDPPAPLPGPRVALFLRVDHAQMNPGLCWTTRPSLCYDSSNPDCSILEASVDHISQHFGMGWFYHEMSGVSLGGYRHQKVARFQQGDVIGLVVDTNKNVGYCIQNGEAVLRVPFPSSTSQPMVFAIHLCRGDEVTLCAPPFPIDELNGDSAPQLLIDGSPTAQSLPSP